MPVEPDAGQQPTPRGPDRPTGTVIVTGASSGVGNSIVKHLSGRFRVIAAARRRDRLEEDFGADPNVEVHGLDLLDDRAVRRFCHRLLSRDVAVGYLVNNAGVNHPAPIVELDPDDLRRSIQVNALAPLAIMQAMLPDMARRGFGRVVNVTSGAPLNCFPGFGAYSGSKALLNALTVTAAREYADSNVRINLMSPGPVRSEMAPDAPMEPAACHPTLDHLLSPDPRTPTGRFFWLGYEVPLTPELDIDWLAGRATGLDRCVPDPGPEAPSDGPEAKPSSPPGR